jgi:hypothetical protein
MVLIIKSTNNQVRDYRRLAAQMINMETNQRVYDDDAKELYPDTKETKRPKFNSYVLNSVEFDFTLTMGTIVLYLKTNSAYAITDHANLIAEEIRKLTFPTNFTETLSNKSNYYTMAKSNILNSTTVLHNGHIFQKCYRKIITDPFYLKKVLTSNTAHFVWLIVIKNEGNFRGSHLSIQEVDPAFPSEIYLNKSICTIIYDDIDIINTQGIKKQINYPSLGQYRMFSQKQILEEAIYVSWTGGLRYEIYYQFTGRQAIFNNITLELNGDAMLGIDNEVYKPIMPELEFKEVELKRLNPDKSWEEQLLETFDYNKQEEDEINLVEEGKPKFPNDICFISKIPLWARFYVIRVKNETCEFDIAVAPSVVHNKILAGKLYLDFKEQLSHKNNKVSMVSLRICSHPRTFLQVLDMIPNKITSVKKNIMRCMEMYGAYSKSNDSGNKTSKFRHSRNYYVMDKNTKQMYVGVKGCNDIHVSLYQNTDTILFRVMVIETLRSPDPLLFPDQLYE